MAVTAASQDMTAPYHVILEHQRLRLKRVMRQGYADQDGAAVTRFKETAAATKTKLQHLRDGNWLSAREFDVLDTALDICGAFIEQGSFQDRSRIALESLMDIFALCGTSRPDVEQPNGLQWLGRDPEEDNLDTIYDEIYHTVELLVGYAWECGTRNKDLITLEVTMKHFESITLESRLVENVTLMDDAFNGVVDELLADNFGLNEPQGISMLLGIQQESLPKVLQWREVVQKEIRDIKGIFDTARDMCEEDCLDLGNDAVSKIRETLQLFVCKVHVRRA